MNPEPPNTVATLRVAILRPPRASRGACRRGVPPPQAAVDGAGSADYIAPPTARLLRNTACPGGGIGRRAGFRYLWPQGRGSSSLLLGTNNYGLIPTAPPLPDRDRP